MIINGRCIDTYYPQLSIAQAVLNGSIPLHGTVSDVVRAVEYSRSYVLLALHDMADDDIVQLVRWNHRDGITGHPGYKVIFGDVRRLQDIYK